MGETGTAAGVAVKHHDSLVRWAAALAGFDREEAMEIVQQTYLEVIEGRADLLGANDPRRFLFGVARKVAASRRRRRSLLGRILRLQPSQRPRPEPRTPEVTASSNERAAKVRAALGKISGRQLEVISLVFDEGLTVEEAASVMGLSVGSARTHYHRGKQRLAPILEEIL